MSEKVALKLQYGFYANREPTAGGFNDYTAHTVYTTMTYRMP